MDGLIIDQGVGDDDEDDEDDTEEEEDGDEEEEDDDQNAHQDDGADQGVGEEANGVTEGRRNLLKHIKYIIRFMRYENI